MYTRRSNLQKFEYSERCLGCRSVIVGGCSRPTARCAGNGFSGSWANEGKSQEFLAKSVEENIKKTARRRLCRHMSRPLVRDWAHLERLARYLLDVPELAVAYRFRLGSCRTTRRSATGGAMLVRGREGKTWGFIQGRVALSSAEAEVYASVQAGREGLGVR